MADYTQTYTVVLEPVQGGWYGYCLEIPESTGRGQGKRAAYKAVKESIQAYLSRRLAAGQPIPRRDRVIKYPRFDLRNLGFEVNDLR